jgi:ubiquinone/menaquinone biosynthesis C-methylase UbiE
MKDYYAVKNMAVPSRELYGIPQNALVLLVGTAKKQEWAVTIDIDINAPCNVVADGLRLPFSNKQFDYVILDYVANFIKHMRSVGSLISEANRVGKTVVGRVDITPGRRLTLKGAKPRFTLPAYPKNVIWMRS